MNEKKEKYNIELRGYNRLIKPYTLAHCCGVNKITAFCLRSQNKKALMSPVQLLSSSSTNTPWEMKAARPVLFLLIGCKGE